MKVLLSMLIAVFTIALSSGDKSNLEESTVKAEPLAIASISKTIIDSVAIVDMGKISEKQYFADGLLVKQEGYTLQKKLVYTYSYLNGLKHGKWAEFYENGEQYLELNYFFGERNGIQKVYNSDGSFQYWVDWINGVQLSRLDCASSKETAYVIPKWKMNRDGC